jgi:hypothetical protein
MRQKIQILTEIMTFLNQSRSNSVKETETLQQNRWPGVVLAIIGRDNVPLLLTRQRQDDEGRKLESYFKIEGLNI